MPPFLLLKIMPKQRKTLIITLGDPLGIGPEIALKSLKHFPKSQAEFIIISDEKTLEKFTILETSISLKLVFPSLIYCFTMSFNSLFDFG